MTNADASTVRPEDFTQWRMNGKDMRDLHADIPVSHWTERVKELRAGYDEDFDEESSLYLDLALEMFRTLGYYPAHQLAQELRETADGSAYTWDLNGYEWPGWLGKNVTRAHRELFAELGWEQAQLLSGWLINIGTMRDFRDHEYERALRREERVAKTVPDSKPGPSWPTDRLF